MAFNDTYRRQVELLIRTLPHVAKEPCFALKGGTAINLFIRNMSRLSVDIDLTYLPITERALALQEIDSALKRIAQRIRNQEPDAHITESAPTTQQEITKLVIRKRDRAQIKIEVTPVLRGCVYEPILMRVCATVEEQFGFAEMKVLSFADLYAGKIMAALDRQHPRDLFDVHQLLQNEGINAELRNAIIIYLISHDHSPHSLLNPVLRDITQDFEQSFAGMTDTPIELSTLLDTRQQLINDIRNNMPEQHKKFLFSFYNRTPEWDLLGVSNVENLPAIRWREHNLDKSGKGTKEAILGELREVIGD